MSWLADCAKGIVYSVRGKAARDAYELQLSELPKLRAQIVTLSQKVLTLEQERIMFEQESATFGQEKALLTAKIRELERRLDGATKEIDALRHREEDLMNQVKHWSSLALEYRPKHLPPLMPPTP